MTNSNPQRQPQFRRRLALAVALTGVVAALGVWDWAQIHRAPEEADAEAVAAQGPGTEISGGALHPPQASGLAPTMGLPSMPTMTTTVAIALPTPTPTTTASVVPEPVGLSTTPALPTVELAAAPEIAVPMASTPEPASTEVTAPATVPIEASSAPDLRVVVAIVLHVRAGPSSATEIVTKLEQGAVVTVSQSRGHWVFLTTTDGRSGWVSGRYLRPIESPATH